MFKFWSALLCTISYLSSRIVLAAKRIADLRFENCLSVLIPQSSITTLSTDPKNNNIIIIITSRSTSMRAIIHNRSDREIGKTAVVY